MIVDPHSLQVPLLCLIRKSAPNILWSVGGVANNQLLQVRKESLALMVRISLMSLLAHSRGLRVPNRLAKGLGGIGRIGHRATD
jgi:hypothetical protein